MGSEACLGRPPKTTAFLGSQPWALISSTQAGAFHGFQEEAGPARHLWAEAAGPCIRSVDLEAWEEAALGPAGGRTAKPSLTSAREGQPRASCSWDPALSQGTLSSGSSSAAVLTFINHCALLPFILKPHMEFFPYTAHFKVCISQYGRCSGSGSFSFFASWCVGHSS